MKHYIFMLLILASCFAILIAPAVGTKEKKAEPVSVQSTETTPSPQITPVQPEEPATIETTKDSRAGEEINWQVILSGGSIGGTSASYALSGTVGQTATEKVRRPAMAYHMASGKYLVVEVVVVIPPETPITIPPVTSETQGIS